jgi:hypothetical protein
LVEGKSEVRKCLFNTLTPIILLEGEGVRVLKSTALKAELRVFKKSQIVAVHSIDRSLGTY